MKTASSAVAAQRWILKNQSGASWPMLGLPRIVLGYTKLFLDERERIYILNNEPPRTYVGPDQQPACAATLKGPGVDATPPTDGSASNDGHVWEWWRNKQPRTRLIGDKP